MLRARAGPWLVLLLSLVAAISARSDPLPRSMLILEQSDARGSFYTSIFVSLRSEVNAKATSPVTIYSENLDFSHFSGSEYEESLRRHYQTKYRDRPIGVVVPIGAAALDYALRWRSQLWPSAPVVFAFVDTASIAKLKLPDDVVGLTTRLSLTDMVTAARAVVPELAHVAVVGDRFETQTAYAIFKDELPRLGRKLDVMDLTGLPMRELRRRVAALPDKTAILYTAIYSDGAGAYFTPGEALEMFAKEASRPIIAPMESYVGRGAVGGYVEIPSVIGQEAARIALEIIDGRKPATIPIAEGNSVRSVFDWRELQRWGVDEANLPAGSEVRFRVPTLWEEYPGQTAMVLAAILLQSGLLAALLYEHRRRRRAEVQAHARMNELAHINRQTLAGELSASIAHELNQPLGAILSSAEAAELLLEKPVPDLAEIKTILAEIRRDDLRASEIIKRLRRLLKKAQLDMQHVDLKRTIEEVFDFVRIQAAENDVELDKAFTRDAPVVLGDPIQLQQAVLNLVLNGIDAVRSAPPGSRRVSASIAVKDRAVEIRIADTGAGIPADTLKRIFDPLFSTKDYGMGMGLTIARTIIEVHHGSLRAANEPNGGAAFYITLPHRHSGAEQSR